jgi:D-alanine-D-alanine ligase-like ATP-grasp enzyme
MTKEEEFKEKESLLKKNWKVMDPLQREKSLAGSGVQESTSTKRQELIEKEARLLKDKSALSEDDKRHSLVVNDLSRKFQVRVLVKPTSVILSSVVRVRQERWHL